MAKRPLPDQETLLKLLRYEPSTGKLFWHPRPITLFADQDWEARSKWNTRYAHQEAFTATRGGYRCGAIFGVNYQAHRIIWVMVTGRCDPEIEVDHENGNRSDNRWSNLRLVTPTGNRRNAAVPRHNTSGVIGVGLHRGKWRAHITVNRRQVHIGEFVRFSDAVRARRDAEPQYGFHSNHGRARSY